MRSVRHKQKACTICILLLCSRHKSILSFASYTERGRAGQHAVQLYARRCVLCGTQKKRVESAFCCFVEGISRSFPLPRTQNVGEQGSMLYSYMHTYTHTLTHTHAHTQNVGEQGSMLYSYMHKYIHTYTHTRAYTERGRAGQHAVQLRARRCVL